jgi:hypothetical protein
MIMGKWKHCMPARLDNRARQVKVATCHRIVKFIPRLGAISV